MKLGTFMMPLHPPTREPWQTYQEDREAIILADKLGYAEALGEQHRFAILGQRLPRKPRRRVQRHHERPELHRSWTSSTLPLRAERTTASSAATFAIISSCGTGYGARPAAASANASRFARTAFAGS